MANKKENLKSLFSNTRTRIIIIFTFLLLLLAFFIGYLKLRTPDAASALSSQFNSSPGDITSIPGSANPTAQYAQLQMQQNANQADTAQSAGDSAIPTIIRTQSIGDGVGVIGSQSGVGFTALANEQEAGPQQSLWIQNLQNGNCSKASIANVTNQGAQLTDLKAACSCTQLKDSGFGLQDLENICACKELKAAGYNVRQLKAIGYSAERLRNCGFDACELRNSGFTAQEMKDGGFSDGELKGAGFTPEEIARAGGLPDGILAADVLKAGCGGDSLDKLRKAGVSAAAIRRITGCSVAQLKEAGFSPQELKDAGFSAADLKKAGFTPDQLKTAGYTARDLLNAGYSPEELVNAGFTTAQIKAAQTELPPGISVGDVKNAGCNIEALKHEKEAGVSAMLVKQNAGCNAQALKAAGFTDVELANAGFSVEQITAAKTPVSDEAIKATGCDPAQLKQLLNAGVSATRIKELNGCSVANLKAAGYDVRSLLDAGFSPDQLAAAGFNPQEVSAAAQQSNDAIKAAGCDTDKLKQLFAAGVSASKIKALNGCNTDALKAAGFTAQSLIAAGFTPDQLAAAGFSQEEINAAQLQADNKIKAAGCDPSKLEQLLNAGVSATQIKELNGCSATALKAAGFSARALIDAGYSPEQLAEAGFSPQEISAAQKQSDDTIKTAGCDPTKLKQLLTSGVSATRIKTLNGCSADVLKQAGFTAKSLLAAGFSPAQLQTAGFTPDQINAALNPVTAATIQAVGCDSNKLKQLFAQGVSAAQIKELNGCSADVLKQAGFSAKSLLDAGFTADQLKTAGYTAEQIDAALSPISDQAIQAAGCDPNKLKKLYAEGVSAARIRALNGCSAQDLNAGGFDAKSLLDAGFTPANLLSAGYTEQQLQSAGVNPADILAAGRGADCSSAYLQKAKAHGLSAETIKQTLGCSAAALKASGYTAAELKNAGFTAAELKNAGFSATELKNVGFSAVELKNAGFSAADLKQAGFSVKDLKSAGFSASDLKAAGFTAEQLKAAGYTAKDLKDAGYSASELKTAGYSAKDVKDAGYSAAEAKKAGYSPDEVADAGFSATDSSLAGLAAPNLAGVNSNLAGIPSLVNTNSNAPTMASNAQQLQAIVNKQNEQIAEQKYQQKIQQRANDMIGSGNQLVQGWKDVSQQAYMEANAATDKAGKADAAGAAVNAANGMNDANAGLDGAGGGASIIKMGDILFAVMDTAVNSDEPGPILATIVSGKFKGTKLIGSFNLPSNANKMVITFNAMSIPGNSRTVSISAFAIDPNTARTALSSRTDHHYLMRYGSLFASSFLQGFGNAFQSADTTVTIGGTGAGNDITVQNGIGRSALENAVIGLAQVGQSWGQVAQQAFNTPVTVEVYAGTGIGVLFTQDVSIGLT